MSLPFRSVCVMSLPLGGVWVMSNWWEMIWMIYWTRLKESFGRSPVNLPPPPIKALGMCVVTSHSSDCVYGVGH